MTVLVDAAIWPWRGRRWAHLVSDSDLDELHDFAQRLGVRRIGFQGDHYDVDADRRLRAIELGAAPVNARVLVGALKSAGLRDRRHPPRWQEFDRVSGPKTELVRLQRGDERVVVITTAGADQLRLPIVGGVFTARHITREGDVTTIELFY